MKHSDSPVTDKLNECESNYVAFTDIFLYFLTDYFYLLHEEEVSDEEKKELERKLLLSLTSLEKIHYHFFHQKDLLEKNHYHDTPMLELNNNVSEEYTREVIRKQIIELKRQIEKHPFSLDSYKIRCMDNLHLLLSYYPKITIINHAPPPPPWLSFSSRV